MKKNTLYIIVIVISAVLIIAGGSFTGFYLWHESTFQTADAEQQINEAMVDYSSIVSSANAAGESIKNVTSIYSYVDGSSQVISPEEINKARAEIDRTKKVLATADQNFADYYSRLESTNTLNVKDDYRTYLIKVREAGDGMTIYVNQMVADLAIMEKILNAYSYGQLMPASGINYRATNLEYSDQILQKINVKLPLYISEKELYNLGILDARHEAANQYFVNCDNKLAAYATAVKSSETARLDALFSDYQSECSNEKYASNIQLRNATWAEGMQKYFSQMVIRLNDSQCASRMSIEAAQSFHNSNI